MRVFVTGASGWIGSAVVPELLGAGHEVVGLARSDASAAAIEAVGATVRRGDLDDLDALSAGAAEADGVIHLAFIHDFSQFAANSAKDRVAIEIMGAALAGSGRPLVIASGVLGITADRPATELDQPYLTVEQVPRLAGAEAALGLADQGVRSCVLRLPPSVHGAGDHGFISTLVGVARDKGVAGYIGDGSNRWPAVARADAARLFRLAVEKAPAGSVLHAVDDGGVPTREIAEVFGRHLGLPVASVAPEDVDAHFGWIGRFWGIDATASSALTREWMDWAPTLPGLIADLEEGHYFA